jgi:hypothetical protein
MDVEQLPTPAEVAQSQPHPSSPATLKGKSAQSPTQLHKISEALAQVISKHNLHDQTRKALNEILELVKKENLKDERERTCVPILAVKTIHEQFKANLVHVQESIETKLSNLQSTVDSLNKSTESLQSTARELESKVVKVNDSTDMLASTTKSYRDAILAKPQNPIRSTTDPKVLDGVDRRARQILLGLSDDGDNAALHTSLLELKDKANKIITELDDPIRPETVNIENVSKTHDGSLLLLLNSKEATDWLREPDVERKFLDKFANGAIFRDRSYNVILRWVPITFNPNSRPHLREIEKANSLPDHSIHKARWIKPVNRRRSGQAKAHATLTFNSADVANSAIKGGLDICEVRVRAERTKQESLQCLKCRGWEHKAQDCEAQTDACGTCGKDHRTSNCNNKGNLYCVSCKSDAHASWDRTCLEFLRRCDIYNDRYPENNMVYFPTDQDWTLTARPSRIPVQERFPKRYVVNSLPVTSRNPPRPTVRLPPSNSPKTASPPRTQVYPQQGSSMQARADPIDRLLTRTQPNLIPLGRGREKGDLSDPAENNSTLDHSDSAIVEQELDWDLEPPQTTPRGFLWDQQLTGW